MKLVKTFLLASILLCVAFTLQLSSHKDLVAKQVLANQDGPRPYYPKHYLGHRSQAYKQKVREENRKKIEGFNNNNKKKLKAVGAGGSSQVTGGNSFVMGQTKFIDFTEEEFIKLFTGLNRQPSHHHHHKKAQAQNHQQTHEQSVTSKSHKIFENHMLNQIDPSLNQYTQEMQSHDEKVWLTNEPFENVEHGVAHDASVWSFADPYKIDDSYIDNLYGNVNSDSNWGWDWTSLDKGYYSTPSTSNYSNYWKSWQDEHWGFDWGNSGGSNTANSGLFGGWDIGWGSNSNTDSWWNSWSSTETSNKNNDTWWNFDSWFDTPSTPITPVTPITPITPSNPTKPTNNTNPSNPNGKVIAAYPKDSMDVNWVIKGATTHIKEQGECGSCWTYSAIGVIESYFLIKGLGKMDLSEQQLVDCQKNRCLGCNGGFENLGLDYAAKNGLVAEEKYPYKGVEQKCQHAAGPHKIPKYIAVPGRTKMEEALRKGPITGGVYVDDGFQFYKKGIFDRCIRSTANHAVVIVGFTKDYWIIRNSWGTDWGEDGHIRIKRNQNNNNACSIEDQAYAVSQ